jgi:dUTP pyrophosphatase
MSILNIKRLTETAKIPTKAYPTDLGYDLYADETVEIWYMETVKIKTGIAVGFPEGWGGFIMDRSSMASKCLVVSGGVIDQSYIGELSIIMTYTNVDPTNEDDEYNMITIKKGDKIAQLVPIPVTNFSIVEVSDLESSERGERGFGSSDKINML